MIPTLNEAARLPDLLADLASLPCPHQVVVVDGGSLDRTREIARTSGHRVITALRGRARQMNRGAAALETDWLLFLHADSRLPPPSGAVLARWLEEAVDQDVGIFRFRLDGQGWFWRFIEVGQRFRQTLYGLAYGDQGLLVHRTRFDGVGGFPDQPLMEDVEVLRRLRRAGATVRVIDAPLLTSPRRYERDGRWLGWLRNATSIGLYLLGVSPRTLARWYGADLDARPTDRLLVFAKAPRPGRVKTRLARDVGPDRAALLYRRMGRAVVDAVRDGPFGVTICFDPEDAEAEMREWLDEDAGVAAPLEWEPQGEGDLGARMERALRRSLSSAERVCLIGTDAPDVDATLVMDAFDALSHADVVLGPATDGGYYLIGVRAPAPSLFRQVPWSTPDVFTCTVERARQAGLTVQTLPELRDVDTVADLAHLPRELLTESRSHGAGEPGANPTRAPA